MDNKKIEINVIDKKIKQKIDIHIKKPEIALEKINLDFIKGDKGDTGEQGETGVGISTITKTSTSGLVDTYTITLTDGNASTFDVTNGKDGEDGQTGADGKSAYETAQEGGYSGTEQQFSSALANIDNFITKAVNDLTYYYTKTEVNSLIGAITTITATIVSVLPTADSTTYFNTSKTIYMVKNSAVSGTDYYYEYITIRTGTEGSYVYSWEKIGDTQIDLSGYVQTSRKINNKALTSDITLTASDVGALPDTTIIPTVNNPTITLTQGGVTKGSFTLNQSSGDTIALDAGGGSSTDVQVDSVSVVSGSVANINTINGNYNASSNKLATASDLPDTSGKADVDLSNVTYPSITAGSTTTGSGDRVIEQYLSSDKKTWYRKWASGWKECGGKAETSSSDIITINLPISFTNSTSFFCYGSFADNTGGPIQWTRITGANQIEMACSSSGNKAMYFHCCGY